MIAQLSGIVARTAATYVVLDVQGVGYKVAVPVTVLEGLPPVGAPLSLITHMQVREDDISLYGFLTEIELRVFELLLSVSGIGPKAALGLLSALPAESLADAVSSEDIRTLTRVPGIGAKTAQRMVLELKEKFLHLGFERRLGGLLTEDAAGQQKDAKSSVVDDVVSALDNLGYSKAEAQRAVDATLEAQKKNGEALPEFAALLRSALNRLTGK